MKFFKIHGSCNWIFKSPKLSVGHKVVFPATIDPESGALKFGVMRNGTESVKLYMVEKKLKPPQNLPVMSLYTRWKNNLINRDIIEAIQEGYRNHIHSNSLLIVIGIQPQEYDNHIWDPISEFEGELILVGDKQLLSRWVDDNRDNNKDTVVSRHKKYYNKISRRMKAHLK